MVAARPSAVTPFDPPVALLRLPSAGVNGDAQLLRPDAEILPLGDEGQLRSQLGAVTFQQRQIELARQNLLPDRLDEENPRGLVPANFVLDRIDVVVGFELDDLSFHVVDIVAQVLRRESTKVTKLWMVHWPMKRSRYLWNHHLTNVILSEASQFCKRGGRLFALLRVTLRLKPIRKMLKPPSSAAGTPPGASFDDLRVEIKLIFHVLGGC